MQAPYGLNILDNCMTCPVLGAASFLQFFRCTAQFCDRCFSERLGYVTPKRGEPLLVRSDQPHCDYHNRPMFISSLDRQRNVISEAGRTESLEHVSEGIVRATGVVNERISKLSCPGSALCVS